MLRSSKRFDAQVPVKTLSQLSKRGRSFSVIDTNPAPLLAVVPFLGTNPTLGKLRMLTDMGHRVTYVHSPTWRDAVENRTFCPYDDYPLFPSPFQDPACAAGVRLIGRLPYRRRI